MSFHSYTLLFIFALFFTHFILSILSVSFSVYNLPTSSPPFWHSLCNFTHLYQQKQFMQLIYAVLCILVHLISNKIVPMFNCICVQWTCINIFDTIQYEKFVFPFSSFFVYVLLMLLFRFYRIASYRIKFNSISCFIRSSVTWPNIERGDV